MQSWPKKIEARTFPEDFCIRNFLGRGGAGWAVMPPPHWLLLCLRVIVIWPGFVYGHQSRPTRNHLDRAEKFQKLLRWLAPLTFLIRVQTFRHPLRGELPHIQIFMNDGPNPLIEMPICSVIDLAEIRRSSKISSWIWSVISGVVTVLVRPGRGASQAEKSPRLSWATQFLTVAYDGACSLNVSIRMAPCLAGKKTWR